MQVNMLTTYLFWVSGFLIWGVENKCFGTDSLSKKGNLDYIEADYIVSDLSEIMEIL